MRVHLPRRKRGLWQDARRLCHPRCAADLTSYGEDELGAAPRASRQLFETLGENIGAAGPLELSVTWYEVRGAKVPTCLKRRQGHIRRRERGDDTEE